MAARRWCEFCGDELPEGSRPNKKFCDEDCRRSRSKTPPAEDVAEFGEVAKATEEAIAKAKSEGRLGTLDAGAVAALRVLARKIDEEQARWEYALEWAQFNPGAPGGPKPPAHDNVSIPTFLRYAESLGLTPAGRGRIADGKPSEAGGTGGTLLELVQSVPKPAGG